MSEGAPYSPLGWRSYIRDPIRQSPPCRIGSLGLPTPATATAMRTAKAVIATVIALALVSVVICYGLLRSQALSARKKPGKLEYAIAAYALGISIPTAAKRAKNPVKSDPDALAGAGKDYSDHCAFCHGDGGAGNTDAAKGLSPEVPDLRAEHIQKLSDGEMFYIIKNGIRFTGMPGSYFQDERIWKLVLLIRQFTIKNQAHRR